MAFEMGRHVIGYEVQKVLAAVDIFTRLNAAENRDLSIGVAGVGEGGLNGSRAPSTVSARKLSSDARMLPALA